MPYKFIEQLQETVSRFGIYGLLKPLFVVLGLMVWGDGFGQVSEDFDDWSDGSYGTTSTNPSSEWESYNSVTGSLNARSGNAVRFNDDSSENEYLLYQGLDGNGKDDGIGSISFWYRHWNGGSSIVIFAVEYSIDAGSNWTQIGSNTSATSTTYSQFSETVDLDSDNILIRVKSIDDAERLMIDDFEISNYVASCASAPASQHTNFQSSGIVSTSFDMTWTQLADTNVLVIMREGSSPSSGPVDATSYTGNSVFGSGTALGGGYCVFSGSGSAVTITGLTPGEEYFVEIFAYCGSPEFYNTTSPLSASVLMEPDNPIFSIDCATSTYMDLSWVDPASGSWDGFVVIARENASPTTINSADPSALTFNTDFSSAPSQGLNKVVYKGSGNSTTITGITSSLDYSFKIFAYKTCTACDNPSLWEYSSGTQSTETAELSNVTDLATNPAETSIALNWNSNASCRDEIIVVASESPIAGSPSGSNYTVSSSSFIDGANPTLGVGENVVYSGTGSSVTVTDLTTDTEYCFSVFVRKGTEWSTGASICETPRISTSLVPGDLSIISVVTDVGSGADEFCFISYKSITENTSIEFTDNGYERVSAGLWGETEGVYQLTRINGSDPVPAGSPICLHGNGTNNLGGFDVFVCGTIDTDWTVTAVNGFGSFNLNSEDQIWIMQGGSWANPSGSHNATYDGSVLYGWTAVGWEDEIGAVSSPIWTTKGSTLYPNSACLNTDLQTFNDIVKYVGPFSAASKVEWITLINDSTNWDDYSDYSTFSASFPRYVDSCVTFTINAGVYTEGLWKGEVSSDWFDCANWASLRLPESNIDVEIPDVMTNDPVIDTLGAKSNNITINVDGLLSINNADSEIEINGDLIVEGTLSHSDGNIVFVGDKEQIISDNNATIGSISFYELEVNKPSGLLRPTEDISISSTFSLTNGIIALDSVDNSIILPQGVSVIGGSNASHVDGFISKSGTENFRFPIGNNGFYQPIAMTGLTGSATFRAKYTEEAHPNAGPYYDGEAGSNGTLEELGHCDFWTLNRTAGTASANVTLTYGETPCNNITDVNYLSMGKWDGSFWEYPVIGVDPTSVVNEISSTTPFSTFSDFVIASTGGDQFNVLPIALTFFDAKALSATVMTEWETSTETNNDYFTIERSADASQFEEIARIDGAGTSHEEKQYSFEDLKPYSGISYYRLKQTDFDGAFSFSDIHSVEMTVSDQFEFINAYRSESNLNLVYRSTAPYLLVEIFDVTGQRVFGDLIENYGSFSSVQPHLQRGAYVVRLSHGDQSQSRKFVW